MQVSDKAGSETTVNSISLNEQILQRMLWANMALEHKRKIREQHLRSFFKQGNWAKGDNNLMIKCKY